MIEDDDEDEAWRDRPIVTVDQVLEAFFAPELARATGRRLQRLLSAADDLRSCLEAEADGVLTTGDLEARELERAFEPRHPAARVATAYALLDVLPGFLEDEHWWGSDLEDRRLRVRLTLPLARLVARQPVEGWPNGEGAGLWTVEAAVRTARWALRAARAARSGPAAA